ncbi:hypothetical protein FHP25_25055 [Vineibacter terrae]|uniref:Uncharacterized protein n=1 Tax=Vineibacter terrae TaxID=2586908 RepID=A0A5C8PFI9_9HYPH|nr:hypothetical protein [Vineibacter terrae]TXL72568.1 hypothetical protein FHP25_25055 [Vineibacter terrae]
MMDAGLWALWVANAVTSLAIAVCALWYLLEKARGHPLWLRLCLYGAVVGGLFNIIAWPYDIELGQVAINAGFAGTMIYRLRRRRLLAR